MKLLTVSGSPHVHSGESVKKIMWTVVIAMIPAWIIGVLYFGLPAIYLTIISVVSCVLFEYLFQRFILKTKTRIYDGSAVITGLLLAFNLPTYLPFWMVIIGAFVSIVVAKMSFGGLGSNIFNPALVGRVFLLISFPTEMTTWPRPLPLHQLTSFADWVSPKEFFANTLTSATTSISNSTDAWTGATWLSQFKTAKLTETANILEMPDYMSLMIGEKGGSFGEISVIAILIGLVILLVRKVITWHIPVSFVGAAFVFAAILHWADPTLYIPPSYHIMTGGLMLGAVFMATDMVTSPTSPWGMIIFGTGCGILTILIRVFGAYPEGVSFAILIMNALVPLINKGFKPKKFGVVKTKK